jgi:hypothetical protein
MLGFEQKPAQEAIARVKKLLRICGEHDDERKNCTSALPHREMRCTSFRNNGNLSKSKEKRAESWTPTRPLFCVSVDS